MFWNGISPGALFEEYKRDFHVSTGSAMGKMLTINKP